MEITSLNPFAVSGLFTAITYIPLSIFLWLTGRTKVARLFGFHAFTVGWWGVGAFISGINKNPGFAITMFPYVYVGVLFIPVSLLHTIKEMTGYKWLRYALVFAYLQAVYFSIPTLQGKMFVRPHMVFDQYAWFTGTPLYILSYVVWLAVVGMTHTTLLWFFWKGGAEQRKQMYILTVAAFLGFGGGLTNFFLAIGVNIYPWGNFLVPVFSIMVAYAIFEYQLFDVSFVLRKGIVYTLLIGIVAVMYSATILLVQPVIERLIGHETSLSGLLAAILLGVVYAPMRLKIEYFVDQTIFRGYSGEIARQNALMEGELVRAERFKMVSALTRDLATEICDPLTAIKTHSLLIGRWRDNKEFVIKALTAINRQTGRVNGLLEQLVKFSSPEELQFKETSIYNVIEDVLNIQKESFVEKKVEVVKDYQTDKEMKLNIDAGQMRQALYNLVDNAVEAMGKKGGGTLTVTTREKEGMVVNKDSRRGGGKYFEIILKDTGVGIAPEEMESIFDPFYRKGETKKEAPEEEKVLGLSITHRIIKQHGGYILVESEVGKGSIFTVDLSVKG